MNDFASWTELIICACIIMSIIYVWGKVRIYLAFRELSKVEKLLHEHSTKKALKGLEHLKIDLEDFVHYWYVLGIAFAQLGCIEYAENAFNRVLEFDADYLDTKHLLTRLIECSNSQAIV